MPICCYCVDTHLSLKIWQLMARLPLLYFSLISLLSNSFAIDTISSDGAVRDGETIVSSGESFELGFLSPGNSESRYLCIWYKKKAAGTVVWVANREVPVDGKSGSFRFDGMGSLVVLNQDNRTVWSSNTSGLGSGDLIAQLLDSGNLVIRRLNDRDPANYLWQSFDHPGNTFLSDMKVGVSDRGENWVLTAWNSEEDPSSGLYTFQLDESGLQLQIKQNSSVIARSGVWNGVTFNGLAFMKPNPVFTYRFVYTQKQKYFTYQLVPGSVLSRMILTDSGVLQMVTWNDRDGTWNNFLSIPVDHCDTYSLCGPYGICDIGNTPVCGCLKGFEPKNQAEWMTTEWSGGCVRETPLDCEKGDGFIKFSNVRLPDLLNYTRNESMRFEECRIVCLSNCSCMAYAVSNVSGEGSGCFLWFGELTDLKQFRDYGQDVYIRMAASETVEHDRKNKQKIILSSTLSIAAALLLLGLCLFAWKRRNKLIRPRRWKENHSEEEHSKNDQDQTDLDLPQFDYNTIAKATTNFSFKNMLGQGGFGPVYKGILEEGKEIAVKRLSKESRQGQDEFKNEVKCIAKLQHRNLVKLLGYCIAREEKMLIYEYMPNKSLDCYIFDQTEGMSLAWPRRFQIINGIARGLLYLHQDSRLRIIHRDLKASNILLDNEMNPKISDFGMARIFGGNETAANTKRVVGTYGYMAPEYAIDGVFSVKSDVFSFGVLVLEIISGKRNRGFKHQDHQFNLLGHIWKLYNEGRYTEFIDPCITESCNLSQILRSVHIGLLCVQHNPEDRPKMSSVVLMLNGEGKLAEPKPPGFFLKRKLIDGETSSSNQGLYSIDEATITYAEPR